MEQDLKSHSSRVLFIEDEPFQMEFSIQAMKEAGFEVEIVDTVRDIPARLKEGNFDMILLDIMMDCPAEIFTVTQTRSGFYTGCRIYEEYILKLSPDKPIIVLTALNPGTNLGNEVVRFFQNKGISIFPKPFDDKELVNELKKLIRKGSEK